MKKQLCLFLAIAAFVFMAGCSEIKEPEGTPVSLTQEDLDQASFSSEELRLSIAWFTKANELATNGLYREALYFYHQSIELWPEKIEKENPRIKHLPEPTSQYLKLAELYLEMKEPELALKYYKKFSNYFPGHPLAGKGIAQAKAMLKK